MVETAYKNILVKKEKHVATIILNRPDKLNAISPGFIADFNTALPIIEKDSDIRAVVITGKERAFCAGGDVQEDLIPISRMRAVEWREYIKDFCDMIRTLNSLAKPVIAAINGVTVGGGCDIAMACDIRIASEKAKFGYGYIKMGVISDLGGNYFLPRIIGPGRAKLFAFSGDIIDAKEAERIGLINHCVPKDRVMSKALEIAHDLANGPVKAIQWTKMSINKRLIAHVNSILPTSTGFEYLSMYTQDHKEAAAAFLDGRAAQELRPEELTCVDEDYPMLIAARAVRRV